MGNLESNRGSDYPEDEKAQAAAEELLEELGEDPPHESTDGVIEGDGDGAGQNWNFWTEGGHNISEDPPDVTEDEKKNPYD